MASITLQSMLEGELQGPAKKSAISPLPEPLSPPQQQNCNLEIDGERTNASRDDFRFVDFIEARISAV